MDLDSCLVRLCNSFVSYKNPSDKLQQGFVEENIDKGIGLFTASSLGDLDLVKYYMKRGASNLTNGGMYEAAFRGHLHIVKFAVENGQKVIEINLTSYIAAQNNHKEIVEYLSDKISNSY